MVTSLVSMATPLGAVGDCGGRGGPRRPWGRLQRGATGAVGAAGAEGAVGASFGAIYHWYLPFNASIEIEAVRGLYVMKHLRSSSLAKNSKYYSA